MLMDLAKCYRLLGLRSDARPEQIKASYRRLARQYHPDVNPNNPDDARAKFIQLTEAYQSLLRFALQKQHAAPQPAPEQPKNQVKRKPPAPPKIKLSQAERRLKANSYRLLQESLTQRRFARAIALVEGLAYRFPLDLEVRQWQAITYQQWGRQLIRDRAFEKARIYLQKARRTDPYNRSLSAEVSKILRELDRV